MISYSPSKGCIQSTLIVCTLWHQRFSRCYSESLPKPELENAFVWILSGDTVYKPARKHYAQGLRCTAMHSSFHSMMKGHKQHGRLFAYTYYPPLSNLSSNRTIFLSHTLPISQFFRPIEVEFCFYSFRLFWSHDLWFSFFYFYFCVR